MYRNIVTVLLLCACAGTDAGPEAPPDAPTLSALAVTAAEVVPTVITVSWTTSEPATSRIALHAEDGTTRIVEDPALSTTHALTLYGLAAGRSYTFAVSSETADGGSATSEGDFSVAPAPSWIPSFTLSNVDAAAHAGGYVLMNVGSDGASGAVIVDRDANVVWWAYAGDGRLSTSSVVRRDGLSVLVASQVPSMGGDGGEILEFALDGAWSTTHVAPGLHHSFTELPDGSLLFVAAERRDVDGVEIVEDALRIVDPDGEVRDLFRALDHYTPEARCSHYTPVSYADGAIDWLHANSVSYDEDADVAYLMARNWDALLALDGSTGEPLWQLGGVGSDYAWDDPADAWDHPHYSQTLAHGILAMDNGVHRSPEASRAVEYSWDPDTSRVQQVWEYWDPEGRFIAGIGDVKKLDGGNRLVSWTTAGLVTELADQDVVWQVETELGFATGWVTHLSALPPDAP